MRLTPFGYSPMIRADEIKAPVAKRVAPLLYLILFHIGYHGCRYRTRRGAVGCHVGHELIVMQTEESMMMNRWVMGTTRQLIHPMLMYFGRTTAFLVFVFASRINILHILATPPQVVVYLSLMLLQESLSMICNRTDSTR
jgi:hypothetical protein